MNATKTRHVRTFCVVKCKMYLVCEPQSVAGSHRQVEKGGGVLRSNLPKSLYQVEFKVDAPLFFFSFSFFFAHPFCSPRIFLTPSRSLRRKVPSGATQQALFPPPQCDTRLGFYGGKTRTISSLVDSYRLCTRIATLTSCMYNVSI